MLIGVGPQGGSAFHSSFVMLLRGRGAERARSQCRFAPPLFCVIFTLTHSIPLLLKRQCDRTLGANAEGEPLFERPEVLLFGEGGEGREFWPFVVIGNPL